MITFVVIHQSQELLIDSHSSPFNKITWIDVVVSINAIGVKFVLLLQDILIIRITILSRHIIIFGYE